MKAKYATGAFIRCPRCQCPNALVTGPTRKRVMRPEGEPEHEVEQIKVHCPAQGDVWVATGKAVEVH